MQAFNFEGQGFEYFKIWIVNILLTIVTLGLYYPWAKVRTNRYFYANSTLEGRNFEYHATGKQLFVGYLIAMGLLIAYTVLSEIFPVAGLVLLLIFLISMPWIIWRSLKFNMRVTSFSNVRFGFEGKLGGAYFVYMLLPFLAFLSVYALPIAAAVVVPMFADSGSGLGVIGGVLVFALIIATIVLGFYMFGLLKKRTHEYVINGSRYGQGEFATQLKVAPFVKISLKAVGLFFLMFLAYMVVIALLGFAFGLSNSLLGAFGNLENPEAMVGLAGQPMMIALIGLVYLGFILIAVASMAYATARQRAYVYDNTKLDKKIAFASTMGAGQLMWVTVSNLLLIIFTLGLATPWAKVRIARLFLQNTEADTRIGFDEYVTQKQEEQSSLGEQIGDAFDVEVGIGI